jgi:hypothetical protein
MKHLNLPMRVSVTVVDRSIDKQVKELVFDHQAYLDSIKPEFQPFYKRLFETQMFNSFLKDK